MKPIALVDADILVYSVGFSVEHVYYDVYHRGELILTFDYHDQLWDILPWWDDLENITVDKRREVEPLSHCLHALKETIDSIKEQVNADSMKFYLTGKDNFREKIATILPYKGNRDKNHKPLYYKQLINYLKNKYDAVTVDGMEADDALGIEQTRLASQGIDSVICSRDKDLLQIPGRHYNISTQKHSFVTEEEGIKFFYQQLLTGDSTDNIKGCPGVGSKTAAKLLADVDDPQEMYAICLNEYNKKYDDPLSAIAENGDLLWIRRQPEEGWFNEARLR